MAHLISPITIDSTAYCCACEGGRSTKGVLTETKLFDSFPEIQTAVITNDCSPWTVMTGSQSSYQFYEPEGELSFGVSCGTTVNIDVTASASGGSGDDGYSIVLQIFLDGVLEDSDVLQSSTGATIEESYAITVSGGPCGEIVTITAKNEQWVDADVTTTATLTAEIDSIT